MVGHLIQPIRPVYPAEAKRNRISGKVVLSAIIGRDGYIRDIQIVSAPDDSLAVATVLAVHGARYAPYLVGGVPVEVKTTINCIYNL